MEKIDVNSKIGKIIKAHPDALEALVSIDPKLEKLRNPILRKILASRTSIAMASKMIGKPAEHFFAKLAPLGFQIDRDATAASTEKIERPPFMDKLTEAHTKTLDVRPLLESGKDPLKQILAQVKELPTGHTLKIVNTFEPVPLIKMLSAKGFEVFVDTQSTDLIETYFYKAKPDSETEEAPPTRDRNGWGLLLSRFKNNLVTIDVSNLEMPQPMHTILGELQNLPTEKALFVHHKRIPVFLLPELAQQGFEYRINEVADGKVELLIYKD
ncbi:hypothetical protein BCY91_00090 [Pelobium manganitolerans]|uniref:DUF2249 domain-containing protein n=1 Tax=Pelobium manganitolerans TaxID=1842495 RepID=A0A419SB70_9SPHI|nr:DUF2249 domain-containing protein [Pelobium manganitolerans]RKD20065.1 hypothetical protein BCY91_00090 [Pelobium manganitolerans]